MEIKDIMKDIRESTGLNRKDFCEKFGIPLRTMEEWEAGRRTPPEYIPRMLRYYIDLKMSFINVKEDNNIKENRNINIIKDLDGRQIVVIHDIRFKGKRKIAWDDVEDYLKMYVGDSYMINDTTEMVYIGKDLADEYTGSKDTARLKGTLAKAKANASQGIPEMIEIAVNKRFKKILHQNTTQMQNMDGIDMILVLRFLYMMKII